MPSQPGEGHPKRPMRRQYCCPMPASLELVKIALQAYGNGDCEIALALADPLIRWDERASRTDGPAPRDEGVIHDVVTSPAFKDFMRAAAREIARGMFKTGRR